MKTKLTLLLAAALFCGITAQAQTNQVPNQMPTNAPVISATSPSTASDLERVGTDLWNDFLAAKPFTTNGNATLQIGYGLNTASGHQVEGAILTVPMSSHVSVGALVYHIGSEWSEGAATVSLGTTNNIVIIGQVRSFAGDGVAYNVERGEMANYAFAGEEKDFDISSKFHAGIGYLIANTSDRQGVDIVGGIHLTYWW